MQWRSSYLFRWISGENEEFSYKDYLAQRGIHSLMEYPYVEWIESGQAGWVKSGLFALRQKAYHLIQDFLPQPEAGLLSGILLGIETDIPYELEKAFQNTGTAHVVAISGYNISVIVVLLAGLFSRALGRWRGTLAAVAGVWLYTLMVAVKVNLNSSIRNMPCSSLPCSLWMSEEVALRRSVT